MRRHENKHYKIKKYIIYNKDNEEVLINAEIKIAEDERNTIDKHHMIKGIQVTIDETQTDTHRNIRTIHQRTNMVNAFSTGTHSLTKSITREGNNIHFRNRPTIPTYHQHDKATTMLTYSSGADGHYLSEKDKKKVRHTNIAHISQEISKI